MALAATDQWVIKQGLDLRALIKAMPDGEPSKGMSMRRFAGLVRMDSSSITRLAKYEQATTRDKAARVARKLGMPMKDLFELRQNQEAHRGST